MNIRSNIRRFIGLVLLLWVGLAQVMAQVYRVGDLFTAPDGSQGIVYWLNPDGSGGWVVALNDASAGCPWGETGDILGLDNQNPSDYNRQQLLLDTAGYAHTQAIRSYQNNATSTAAGVVDFAHGWYLPSPAQLSILYGQLPFIEAALGTAGGTTLTTDRYWCSAEVDGDNAWTVYCYYGNFYFYGKTSIYRVRAVRSFTYAPADGVTYAWSDGSTGSSVTVLPSETATWSVTAMSGSCEASDTVTVTRCATVVPSLFDGLVAYYPFDDDDLTDHTGNGNDGNNYGSTSTTDRFCREGKARNFAGVDSPQYIDVPNSSSLQFTDAATVSLWFCMNGKRGMDGWGHSTETGNNHYLFAKLWDYYKNMRTRISVLNSGEFILASEITQSCAEDTLHGLQLGQWMQATIVYTTTYIETYVNGQLVAHTDASNSFSSTNNNPLRFGMMGDDWYPMNGKLDDIRIFNRALDASEVEQLYLLDIVPQDSLLVYLPLNGNVTDYSGNGFQPVLHGNVTPTAGHLYLGDDSTAYHFPGMADSWIEIPHDDRLNLCGSFTVSAWYNRWAGWTYGNLVSKGRDIQYGWKLGTSGTNVNGSSGNDAIASSTPADGYWHLATSVYDASTSTLRYYLDGELEAEATGCGIPHATNYPVAIGRHRSYADDSSDPWPYPFKGDIDDIVIYNRPLSAEEVHALYAYSPHAVGCVQDSSIIPPGDALPCPGHETVTDHEGNVYNTVKIGEQCWTKENMRCTTSPRGHLTAGGSNNSLTTPYYFEYVSTPIPLLERGYLYNWAGTMDTTTEINGSFMGRRGICPEGWHVPSNQEVTDLINYLGSVPAYQCGGSSENVAKALVSTNYWSTDVGDCSVGNNPGQNNATGFSAVPAGYFYNSQFFYEREYGSFWSSTSSNGSNAYWYSPHFDMAYIIRGSIYKEIGRSVRCLLGSIDEPSVSTAAVTDVTSSTAICGGIVTADGGSEINTRGVCWSTSPNPTLNDNYTNDGTGTGAFTSTITGLTPCTTYYVRAFARNYAGTRYGEEFSFTTEPITTTFDTVVCSSELPLTWNGYTFFSEGIHTFTLQNANGCDSSVTLHLIEGSTLTFEMHDSYGDGWNGNKILVHNHDTVQEVTLNDGYDKTVTIPVYNGTLEMEWVDGYWKDECSVTITGPCLYYSTTSAPSGTFINGNINCEGGTPAIPSFTFWTENTCNSVIVHFENTSTDADTVSWNIAGVTTNVWNPTHEFTESGTYPITLQAGNSSCELNWGITQYITVTMPAPIITVLDTTICSSDLPLTWHGHTFTEEETYTTLQQTPNGCDSIVVLTVNSSPYFISFISDDFNDGTIDTAKWTQNGNAVFEENGLLKMQQNVTDQYVHFRSANMNVPASGKVTMDRKFMAHRSNNYYYGSTNYYLNGSNNQNNFFGLQYNYGAYEGWYGIHLVYKLNGATEETRVRLCDVNFDIWQTEHVEVDFSAGTLSYYMDTLVATVSIPGLSEQTVDYYNVEFRPYGWGTGHQHYMDWVDIYGDLGLVSTSPVSDIGHTSATCGGSVSSDDCIAFTTRGVCWSTSHFPTLADAHTSDGSGTGEFTSSITGLVPGTTYYVRAYATNSMGTSYGEEVSFTTLASDTTYTTITIGNGESSDYNLPFNNYYKNSWSQMIYPASQINEAGNITSIAFYVDAVPSMNYPFSTLNIYMGISEDSVNATTNSWLPMSELAEVYSATNFASPIDTGWQTFNLSTPFPYDGSGHLVIVASKTMPNYTNALKYRYTTGAANCCMYRRSDSSPEVYASHPGSATGTLSNRLPDLRLTIDVSGDFCYTVTNLAVNDITKTGAAIAWSPSSSNNGGYIMQYKTADQSWNEATSINVYDTIYDLTGMLISSTIYDVRIATDCGWDTSLWRSITFTTICDTIASLPYLESFETYGTIESAFLVCWTRQTDYSSSDYPYVSSSYHSDGVASLYFYKPSDNYMYAASEALNLSNYDAGELALSFKLLPYGLSNAHMQVGVMTNPEDPSSFTPLKSYYPSDFNAELEWHSFSIPLTQHYDNPVHIVFFAPVTPSSVTMFVDEVMVDYAPTCSSPSDLAISDIAGTSAIVSWSASQYGDGPYTVEYSHDSTSWSSLTTTGTDVMLSGLEPSTLYYVRVYRNCGSNSSDTITDSFYTHCLAGGELPIGNGTATTAFFPSYSYYKYCYTQQIFLTSEFNGPSTFTSIAFDASVIYSSRTYKIYLMHTTASNADSWLPTDSAVLVYSGSQTMTQGWNTYNFSTPFAYNGTDNLAVIVIDETGSYTTSNQWMSHTTSGTLAKYIYQDSNPYSITSLPSSGSSSTTPNRANVIFGSDCDSVITCIAPNAFISDYDNESIEVTWAPGHLETTWELEYRAEDDAEWTSVPNPSSPTLISNLLPGVSYNIRLRSDCGNDYSEWVNLERRTECTYIASLPYTEDFENATGSGEGHTIPCWTSGTNSPTPYPYTSSTLSHLGTYSYYFYGTSAYYSYAATPRFDDSIRMDSLQIHFHALKTSNDRFVEVGVMTNPDDPATFTLLGTFSPSQTCTFELGEVFTDEYTGDGHYVAFRSPKWVTNDIYLDDVQIDYLTDCAHVSDIHLISVDSTSATIGWTAGGDETSWEVYVVEGNGSTNLNTATLITVTTTACEIADLQPNTRYTAYVRGNCGSTHSYSISYSFVTNQTPAQIPYFCDFEDGDQFGMENGNAASKWYIGTATSNGGSHSLYVSQDQGATNTYNNTASQAWAYRDIYFPESDDDYLLSFDWRCTGESHYDYMMVYLGAPAHIEPNSSAQPDGSMVLTNANNYYPQYFNLKDSYQHFSTVLSGQGTETVRRLYFYWHNDGYGCYNPAASVDNILITPICTHSTEVVTACESYLWEDGNTYTVSGTYVYATIDTDGCANVDTLFLTINHAVTSTSSVTVCGDELPYAWNGITITEAGTYTTTLQAANGCDSTVTLTLNVIPSPTLTHAADTAITPGDSVTLWASGAGTLVWMNADGDTLGIGETLTVTPTETTTYFVTGSSPNLVFNEDFEQGDTGFTTSYNFYNYGNCGNYYIGHENHEMWSWDTGDTMFDHTTGNGMWMMVDAVSNYNIWTQTVNVTPNTDYVFSAWFLTDNIAEVKFEINDVSGSVFTTPQQRGVWERQQFLWNSGTDTTAVLKITSGYASCGGNDFGIDDIVFAEHLCEATESITVSVSDIPAGDALPCPGHETVTDYDGNVYNTVKIGEQCWMKENLRVTHYEDGTDVTGFQSYTNNANYQDGFGVHYTWMDIMHGISSSNTNPSLVQGACPTGWHVPSEAEWIQLTDYVGQQPAYMCNGSHIAKALASSEGWVSCNDSCAVGNDQNANNSTGFNMMPSGVNNFNFGIQAQLWTATLSEGSNAITYYLLYSNPDIIPVTAPTSLTCLLPVRCILGEGCLSSMTEFSATACDSYSWNGQTYTQSGDYTQTFTNAAGCDSVVTLHLTVNPLPEITSVNASATAVCVGSQVTFTASGNSFASAYIWYSNGVQIAGENQSTLTVNYSEPGSYSYSVKAINTDGCESALTVETPTVTVAPSYTVNVVSDGDNCVGGNSTLTATVSNVLDGDVLYYQWYQVSNGVPSAIPGTNSATYTTSNLLPAGSYDYYVVVSGSYAGCSAISAYMPVNVTSPSAADLYDTVCDSYEWNGVTYTESGSYTQTFTNAAGCDSTVTLHLTVYPSYQVSESASICQGDSYDFFGQTLTTAGTYSHTLETVFGCDSVITLTLTVVAPPTLTLSANHLTMCAGGTTTLTASVNASSQLPNNFSYEWIIDGGTPVTGVTNTYNLTLNTAGSHTVQARVTQGNTFGCTSALSSAVTVHVAEQPVVSMYITSGATICSGGTTTMNATVTNYSNTVNGVTNSDIYGGLSFSWTSNGSTMSYHTNVYNAQDQLVQTLLTPGNYTYQVSVDATGYNCQPQYSNTATVTVAPAYTATISGNGNVCEGGSVTLNATVNNVLYNDANYQWYKVTSGYPSLIDGATSSTYETSNLLLAGSYDYYVVVTSSIPGCGVTSPSVPANVVSDPTVTLQGDNSVCVGNSLSFNAFISGGVPGSEYTYSWGFAGDCSGSYETSTPYFTYDANCYDGSLSSHHYYFAVTISRNDNSGCNATSTFHTVDLYNNSTTSISESACGSYTWNGQTYTQSGDYTQTFTNAAGCDSVVTLHLTIHPIPSVSISGSSSIDYGQSATLTAYGANSYSWSTGDNTPIITASPTSTTTYTVTGTSQYGCTATASKTVTVNPVVPTVITNNVYNIGTYSAIGSGNVTSTGGATVTARGVCWSTSHNPTLNDAHSNNGGGTGTFSSSISGLQQNTTYYVRAYATNSEGTAYGNEVNFTTQIATFTITATAGPNGSITPSGTSTVSYGGSLVYTITPNLNCTIENVLVDGVSVGTPTSYTFSNVTANHTIHVTFRQLVDPTVTTDPATSVTHSSATLNATVSNPDNFQITSRGFEWKPSVGGSYSQITGSINGDNFTANLTNLAPNTNYTYRAFITYNGGTVYGADLTFTTLCNTYSSFITITACDSYIWNGQTYSQTGTYQQTLTAVNGCDSIVRLKLTILHSVTSAFSTTECESYNWNEQIYTESGDYTQTLTAANGCDSTVTMHLTILPSDNVSFEATECSRYKWNGETYTESGDYTQTFTNAEGCDSVVTLHLTIEHCTDEILVYPNPTSDHLHILFPDAAIFEDEQYIYAFLYDPAGHLVLKERLYSQETDLILPALNNGLYLLEINVNGNTLQTFKQVIIR